jgi:methylmalonyl-CoA mutase
MTNANGNALLFNEFASVTRESWKAQIIRDLKAATEAEKQALYEARMLWQSPEGITIQPFYTQEDLPVLSQENNIRATVQWLNQIRIPVKTVKQALQLAQEAVEQGADALTFDFSANELTAHDLNQLFESERIAGLPITFLLAGLSNTLVTGLKSAFATHQKGSLNYDPLSRYMQGIALPVDAMDTLAEVIRQTSDYTEVKTLTINTHTFHNAGTSAVQELAFALSAFVEYADQLTNRGIAARDVLQHTAFSLSVSTNYFMEIAKFRALRLLWRKLCVAYGAETKGLEVQIHAQTAIWNKFAQDAHNNILRATIESMAAILGGCDALTIDPYNASYAETDELSRRISRNISIILKDESYFDKVSDPAAGAYFVESLTASLAEAAWQLFTQVEGKGGFVKAWESGFITQEVEKSRTLKEEAIRSGKQVLVGINKYPPKGSEVFKDDIFSRLGGK